MAIIRSGESLGPSLLRGGLGLGDGSGVVTGSGAAAVEAAGTSAPSVSPLEPVDGNSTLRPRTMQLRRQTTGSHVVLHDATAALMQAANSFRRTVATARAGSINSFRSSIEASSHRNGRVAGATEGSVSSPDASSRSFTRSFVVGPLGDCCAASAGLAKGISFCTYANSRADVTLSRPWHSGRRQLKAQTQSIQRAHLEAYIRELRRQMEGPKGGTAPTTIFLSRQARSRALLH